MMMFEQDRVILFLRQTLTSAYISIIPEFTEKLDILGVADQFNVTKTEIEHKGTGSKILFRGIQTGSKNNTAKLKSINGVSILVIDEAEEVMDETVFDTIDLSVRKKGVVNKVFLLMNPSKVQHWIYKRFFEPKQDDVTYIHTTYRDNIDNLESGFLAQLEKLKNTNLKKYNHVVEGEWSKGDSELALWKEEVIFNGRLSVAPLLRRIVVAIDPAVTSTDTSDETGIIVGGVGFDGKLYVLEDASSVYTPTKWCEKAVMLYRKWQADRIIGEANNGGDLIETVLRTVDENVPYKKVHATRNKLTRAEPVASLYEQGNAHHVGKHIELEYEMISWESKAGDKSPNRIDALVWCATELVLDGGVELPEPEFEFF